MEEKTTIQIDKNLLKEIEKFKVHRREPINEVVKRLMEKK